MGTRVLAFARQMRGFFAEPLVSELPDGLGGDANSRKVPWHFTSSSEHETTKKEHLHDVQVFFFGDPWENRTPVTAVKGRCLSRLTNGPLVAGIGLEPMTYRV